jgi:hypothetical protein
VWKPVRCVALATIGAVTALSASACGRPAATPAQPALPRVSTTVSPAAAGAAVHGPSVPPSAGPAVQDGRTAANTVTAAPSQLPAFRAESWVAQAPGPVRSVTGHDIGLNECADIRGAATWEQQGYISSGGNPAILETLAVMVSADSGYC